MGSTIQWHVSAEPEAATEYAGTKLGDYFTNPDVMLETEIRTRKRFHHLYRYGPPEIDAVWVFPVFYTVACILGAKLVLREDASPQIAGRVITDLNEIAKLRVPGSVEGAGYVPEVIRQYEYLRKKTVVTGVRPVFGLHNQSPLGTAIVLRGADLFRDIVTNPGEIRALLEVITETALRVVRFQEEFTGERVERIGMDDDYGGLVSPSLYAEFNFPYMKSIYDESGPAGRFLHSETLGPGHLRFLRELGITHYDAWPYHTLTVGRVKQELPDTYFTWNPETTRDLFLDNPKRVKAKFREALAAGAPGIQLCLCARGVPEENVRAFIEVARETESQPS